MAKKPIKSFKSFTKPTKSDPKRKGHLAWGKNDITITRGGKKVKLDEAFDYKDAKINDEEPGYVHSLPPAEHNNQAAHKDKFTPEMIKAAGSYKSWSPSFNDHLRGADPRISEYASKPHEHLNDMKAVTSHKTVHPLTVYRGFDHHVPIHKAEIGDIIHDKGFTGTSLDKSVAHAFSKHEHKEHAAANPRRLKYAHNTAPFGSSGITDTPKVVAKIHMPAGTKGHHLDIDHGHYHGLQEEREFVLHPGTKFKVTGHSKHIDERGFRYHFIHMNVHQQED